VLKPEVAAKRLEQWQAAEPEKQFLKEVGKAAKKIRGVGYSLLGRKADGSESPSDSWNERQARAVEAHKMLEALPERERLALFRVFFPNLAPQVDAAWRSLMTGPYQQGYARKSFRAPSVPSASFEVRMSWLNELITVAQHFRLEFMTAASLATWAPYLNVQWGECDTIGRLLASVIEAGGTEGDDVFEILCQSARNEHEIGGMGRHVSRALLMASRPDGWDLMEKLLLAAQRQEGLRQSILETVDEAHPEAFRRMLRLIVDHDLARFSAVVRALDVWIGLAWDSVSVKVVNETLARLLSFLEDDKARAFALKGTNAEAAFLALWATAFRDALASIPPAESFLKHSRVEMRYVGTLHLVHLGLPATLKGRMAALADPDLRVALAALGAGYGDADESDGLGATKGLFESLERLFQRLPEQPLVLKPIVWPWTARKASREVVAWHLVAALDKRPPTRLIPYLPIIKPRHRSQVVRLLAEQKKWDRATRETLLDVVGDGSIDVRTAAFEALEKASLQPGEPARLERYLTRKSSDLRRGALGLLLKQNDDAALASADRFMGSADTNQRLAGLELLRQLAGSNRQRTSCRRRGEAYQSARKKLTRDEQTQLAAIAESDREQITLDNALGLMNPAGRSPVVAPVKRDVPFITPAAVRCLHSLDELIHKHRETTIRVERFDGVQEELLGAARWGFPRPNYDKPVAGQETRLPLNDIWEQWWNERPESLRDPDGCELIRAEIWTEFCDDWRFDEWLEWSHKSRGRRELAKLLSGGHEPVKLRYESVVQELLRWFSFLHHPPAALEWLFDALETSYALVPREDLEKLTQPRDHSRNGRQHRDDEEQDWRELRAFQLLSRALEGAFLTPQAERTPEQTLRLWRLFHWRDQPISGAVRSLPDWFYLREAYRLRHKDSPTRDDLLDQFLGPQPQRSPGSSGSETLGTLTARKLDRADERFFAECPEVRDLVEACRARILEVELHRGDTVTPATGMAWSLKSHWGSETLLRILTALGKTDFKTLATWRGQHESRASTLTELAKRTYPRPDEDPAAFCDAVRAAIRDRAFPEQRLLQLVFLAPQWTKFVEQYLAWPGLSEGLYWYLAHMKYVYGTENAASAGEEEPPADGDGAASAGEPKQSAWERLIAERTPLSDEERHEGAIDVAWFRRTYDQLTPKRWQALAEAAKFAANANQARRAQFIGDVLLGRASRRELIAGVKVKRLKDHVRMLGLLPLAAGVKRDADLAERYKVVQEYRRYARGLSSMSKPDALRAVEIGLQNLARTAGYADPLRLEWAMEADAVRDLADGPIEVSKDGVTVTLSLDDRSQPQVAVVREGKSLKSVPPAVRKDKRVAELLERVGDLKKQASRMRWSLETAMCRGDLFTGAELARLAEHAILAPLLQRLVIAGPGALGYPDRRGKALRDHRGKFVPVKPSATLRIAHPHDLYKSGQWDRWQHECFQAERLQPFKQVFRELYVVTRQEQQDGAASHRYAGQQINPQQAVALWGQRGWHTQDDVFKTFHDEGVTAGVSFSCGIATPQDVEGLTLDAVRFYHRDSYKPLPLVNVPPRVFSEVMRDLDLVVSVAHRGGVDPEASASTVEMRAALVRETCALLGLKNVRLKTPHALIDGELANYSLHLGSGNVHRLPGGALCIVPVHAQHRGRLFLPFADDDPKTAEVVSKILLLAKDGEIQDPTILDQLRRV
jgi:hypothetical protein